MNSNTQKTKFIIRLYKSLNPRRNYGFYISDKNNIAKIRKWFDKEENLLQTTKDEKKSKNLIKTFKGSVLININNLNKILDKYNYDLPYEIKKFINENRLIKNGNQFIELLFKNIFECLITSKSNENQMDEFNKNEMIRICKKDESNKNKRIRIIFKIDENVSSDQMTRSFSNELLKIFIGIKKEYNLHFYENEDGVFLDIIRKDEKNKISESDEKIDKNINELNDQISENTEIYKIFDNKPISNTQSLRNNEEMRKKIIELYSLSKSDKKICFCCSFKVKKWNDLVTSHIWRYSEIIKKLSKIISSKKNDTNISLCLKSKIKYLWLALSAGENGFLLCRNHDWMFEYGYIIFNWTEKKFLINWDKKKILGEEILNYFASTLSEEQLITNVVKGISDNKLKEIEKNVNRHLERIKKL